MLTDFINKQLNTAKYKLLKDKTYFGEIPNLRGVWANAKTLEQCREELKEVLEGWLVLRLKKNLPVPNFGLPSSYVKTGVYA
jgi:predicted RNase H-like HicB family nuclease